jgi:hypothetical protein
MRRALLRRHRHLPITNLAFRRADAAESSNPKTGVTGKLAARMANRGGIRLALGLGK